MQNFANNPILLDNNLTKTAFFNTVIYSIRFTSMKNTLFHLMHFELIFRLHARIFDYPVVYSPCKQLGAVAHKRGFLGI